MAFDQDTFGGQNSTSGGSSDSAANDWQANPRGTSACMVVMIDPGAELPEDLDGKPGIRSLQSLAGDGEPMEKSCPHRLTAMPPGRSSRRPRPAALQPNSMSKPPGVFI